jgi:hypothetical protein
VLDDVRHRLRHDEVRARLDLGREPLGRNIDSNRQVQPRHHCADAGPEAAAREDRGEDPVCQLTQLHVALRGVLERLADQRLRLLVSLPKRSLCELQRDDGVDQPLLRAVVEVAHDATAEPRLLR